MISFTLVHFLSPPHQCHLLHRTGEEGEDGQQRPQRGRGVLQRLPALPAGLRLLQGRHALRGARGQRPPLGRGLLPVPLHADRLRQHGAHLPLPQE